MKLNKRTINGETSDTHFLYTDKKGQEWSVVDFEKMMSKPPIGDFYKEQGMNYSRMFGYNWEGMTFTSDGESLQIRDMTVEGVIEQIENI